MCPADNFKPKTVVCRSSGGQCDAPEYCTGSAATCPIDIVLPNTTVCRGAAGLCDIQENCNGKDVSCPQDMLVPNGTVCRNNSALCGVVTSCDGSMAQCPADLSQPCPWAWIPVSHPPTRLVQGKYCGELADKSLMRMTVTDQTVAVSLMAPYRTGDKNFIIGQMSFFITSGLPETLTLNPGTVPVSDFWKRPQNDLAPITILAIDGNTSITVNFTWTRPPFLNASSIVSLSSCSFAPTQAPKGNYCFTDSSHLIHSYSIETYVFEIGSASSGGGGGEVNATLRILDANKKQLLNKESSYELQLQQIISSTGDIAFTVTDSKVEDRMLWLKWNSSGFTIFINSPFFGRVGLLLTPCPSVSALSRSHYYGANWLVNPNPPYRSDYLYTVVTPGPTMPDGTRTLNVDTVGVNTYVWDTVTLPLTNTTWATFTPLSQPYLTMEVRGFAYDFSSGEFYLVERDYLDLTKSIACSPQPDGAMYSHKRYCGTGNNGYSYLVRYGAAVLNVVGYSPKQQGKGANQCRILMDCNENATQSGQDNCFTDMQLSTVSQVSNAIVGMQTTGGYNLLSGSSCIYPASSGLARYSGTFSDEITQYSASLITNGTADANSYIGITMILSTSTKVLCTLHTRGILVANGSAIFETEPRGRCEDTSAGSVLFTANLNKDGSVVTIGVSGSKTAHDGLAVPVTSVVDQQLPSGRYCAFLPNGDFAVVQQNENGTTTVYASVGGSLAWTTLWTDGILFNQGTYVVVNRTTDANGTNPFPVSLASFSPTDGFRLLNLLSSSTVFATQEACMEPTFPAGQYCGVTYAGTADKTSYWSNTTFAVVTVVRDPTLQLYTTTIYASRRVSSSSPVVVTFNDSPWLLPFLFPSVSFDLSQNGGTWTIKANDILGAFTVTMTMGMCGVMLPASSTYCGLLHNSSWSEASVNVTSTGNPDGSMSFDLFLLGDAHIVIPTAFVVNGSVMYWAGSDEEVTVAPGDMPPAFVGTVSSDGTTLQVASSGKSAYGTDLLSSSLCVQVKHVGEYYCGMNGTIPMTLIVTWSNVNLPMKAFIASANSNSFFSHTTLQWAMPMPISGAPVPNLQYFQSNDSFSFLLSAPQGRRISFTQSKCIAIVLPSGDYCGYNDTSDQLIYKISVDAATSTLRLHLPGLPYLYECFGAQTSAGGVFDCHLGIPNFDRFAPSGEFNVQFEVEAVDFQAFVVYSASSGTMQVYLSLYPGTAVYLSQAACNSFPELLRTYTSANVMRSVEFSSNTRIAVNPAGMVFVADGNRNCIFTVDPFSGFVSLFSGHCDTAGYQDGSAEQAMFSNITGILFDKQGTLYVLDSGNARIRTVSQAGVVTSVSGNGVSASVDGTGSIVSYLGLAAATINPSSGRLYVSELYRIRIYNQAADTTKTFIGSTSTGNATGSGTKALINNPGKLSITSDGLTMYFVDAGNKCLRKVFSGVVTTVATSSSTGFLNDPALLLSSLNGAGPPPTLIDSSGNVLILYNGQVWIYVTASSTVTTQSKGMFILNISLNATDLASSSSPSSSTLYIADGPFVHSLTK